MEALPEASRGELRNFGLLVGGIFALLFGALPLIRHQHPRLWPFVLCAVLWIAAVFVPALLRPVHKWWTRLGQALGWFNTRLVLSVMFFLLVVPAGLVMRLLGRDKLALRFDPEAESYRISSRQRSPQSMEKPY